MGRILVILSALICSCSSQGSKDNSGQGDDSTVTEMRSGEENKLVKTPDRKTYIDERIASEIQLEFGPLQEVVNALVAGESYPVLSYEGTMMQASGASNGFNLKFEPYDYYDFSTERNIESKFDFDLEINLTVQQNQELGFVDYTDETNNLAWDYFENLFQIYYYEKDGVNYPLKFVDKGKTEWDG